MKKLIIKVFDGIRTIVGTAMAVGITLTLCVHTLIVAVLGTVCKIVSPEVAGVFGSMLISACDRLDDFVKKEG